MLRIHREDLHAFFPRKRYDNVTCRDAGLLVGQSDIFSGFDSSDSGSDTDHTHDSCDNDICLRNPAHLNKAFHTADNTDFRIRESGLQYGCRMLIIHGNQLHTEFPRLFFRQVNAASTCYGNSTHHFRMHTDYIQRLGPYRSCRPENCYILHQIVISSFVLTSTALSTFLMNLSVIF